MKKIYIFVLVIILGFIFTINTANATTGGSLMISDIKYNPNNNTVYYLVNDNGGRGCLPELYSYTIDKQEEKIIYDCDYAESNGDGYQEKIDFIMNGLIPLDRIDLNNNSISANVMIDYTYHDDYFSQISLKADLFQNDEKKLLIEFPGCEFGQKVNFEGYIVPEKNDLFILVSTKNICFEYRYIGEKLFYVPVFEINDMTALSERSIDIYGYDLIKSDGGIQVDSQSSNQKISTYLNNLGFAAYKDENYDIAIKYFQSAFWISFDYDEGPHLLALFNLSATQSKIGNIDEALGNIEDLLSRAKEYNLQSYYASKIAYDNDFDNLRTTARYKGLMLYMEIVTPTPTALYSPSTLPSSTIINIDDSTTDLSVSDADNNNLANDGLTNGNSFGPVIIILLVIVAVLAVIIAFLVSKKHV